MDYFKILTGKVRACINKYGMIPQGGKIAVGLSGGADSLMLLKALCKLSRYCPEKFTVCAITVDIGFDTVDMTYCDDLCRELNIERVTLKSEIKKEVLDKNTDEPCHICSKIRRRLLCDAARDMGADALALGHNEDDAAQTLLMNLLYSGKFISFSPVTDYGDIKVIRPLVSCSEKLIRQAAEQTDTVAVRSPCPYDKKTRREDMKHIILRIDKDSRGTAHRLVNSLMEHNIDGFKK